jgi:hypothetical protein
MANRYGARLIGSCPSYYQSHVAGGTRMVVHTIEPNSSNCRHVAGNHLSAGELTPERTVCPGHVTPSASG